MIYDSGLYGAVGEVSCNSVPLMQFRYGPYDLTILGKERVSHPVDPFGVAGGKVLLQQLDPMPAQEYLPFGSALETKEQCPDPFGLLIHPVDQPLSDGCGCLERLSCYQIKHGCVPCMPDAGEDRQVVLRTDGT